MSDYASQLHQKALELAKVGFGARFKTYRSTPMLQIQPGDLPVLAVHILREKRQPDGQPNQTMPKFINDLTLGFSGAINVETAKQDDLQILEEMMSELDDILLCNALFVRMTEGVTGMDRVGQYSKVGETTLFEIRVEMNIQFRSYFEPRVPDDLKVIHIETQFPDEPAPMRSTPQLDPACTISSRYQTPLHCQPLGVKEGAHMPVSFNSIPANWRMPLYWVEVDPSMAGYPSSRLASLIIGTMDASGTALPNVPVPVPSVADARQLFGYGSMLDQMVDAFTKNNFAQELWVVPIAEASAGVAAKGDIVVTMPATAAGTLPVYIAGRRIQVFVAAGESVLDIAQKIADAINADMSMPVTAVGGAGGTVALTSKFKGVEGNDIDVRIAYGGALAAEKVPVGLQITVPADNKLSGGTGEVDITDAILNLGDEPYEYVAMAYTDSIARADRDQIWLR